MQKKNISFRVDEEVEKYINSRSKEMNLSRTEFIINSIMNDDAVHIDEKKELVKGLVNISNMIAEIDHKKSCTNEDIDNIKEGIDELWHMLRQ